MSKRDDKTTGGKDDSGVLPESSPINRSSVDAPTNPTPPLVTVFRDTQEVGSGNKAGSGKESTNGVETHAPRPSRTHETAEQHDGKANFIERAGQFLHDVRTEMKRVSWPTTTEVKNTTIITLIAVIFFAFYLFVIDKGIALFITQLERFVEWLL